MADPAIDTTYPAEIDLLPHVPPNARENDPGLEHDIVHSRANAVLNALMELVGTTGDTQSAETVLGRLLALEAAGAGEAGIVLSVIKTGTTHTLSLEDIGRMVCMTNAAANSVVVPPVSAVPFPAGARIDISWDGVGQPSVEPGTGDVLIRSPESRKLRKRHAKATLIYRPEVGLNVWDLEGNLEAAT